MRRFAAGVWEFVVGDDWRLAAGVVVALGITALVATTAVSAWWVAPALVGGLLWWSVLRASG
jgi:hypothetical protein